MNADMPKTAATEQGKKAHLFAKASIKVIIRAEANGRFPERFIGTGQEIWRPIKNELAAADPVKAWIEEVITQGGHSQNAYLSQQAAGLGLELSAIDI